MINFRASLKRLAVTGVLAGSALLTGCASFYVDTATKEVPVAQYKKPAAAKPVHVTFEFQNKGAPNSRATAMLQGQVTDQVVGSGMFIAAAPSSDKALLNVTIDNVPIDGQNPAAQGFVTGLTFGLVGSAVTDGYVCTVTYLPPGKTTPITTTARHAVHTTLGNASAPATAAKSANAEDAVRKMTKEIVSNALLALSNSPEFQ